MGWALLVFSGVMLAGVAPAAGEGMTETEQIGPYQLERVAEGLEIRSGASQGLRGVLAIAAVLCIVGAVVVMGLVASSLPSLALGAVGLALALAAGMAPSGPDRVRVSEAGLVVQGFVGRQGRTSADAVGTIEVRRRTPSGAETKRSPRPRIWQVTVRGVSNDTTVVRFRLASHQDATRLAERIGEILGRTVVQREGLAR